MAKRVLVLGNGIIGLSSALAALQRGMDVTILDRNAEHADSCSLGNAGMIVPSHLCHWQSLALFPKVCGGCGILKAPSTCNRE